MKASQSYFIPTVFLLSLTLTMGCSQTEGPAAQEETSIAEGTPLLKGSGPSASGQGSITSGEWRIFAFHAVTHPNGTVKGNGVLNRTAGGVKIQFDIDCLSISGNVATMTGRITGVRDLDPEFVGSSCWFKVVDNGEGANANPDEITFFAFCAPPDKDCLPDCNTDLTDLSLVPIEAGNIQVKP